MSRRVKINSPSAESNANLVAGRSRVTEEEIQATRSYEPGAVVEVREFNSNTDYRLQTVVSSYLTSQYGWVCFIDYPAGRKRVSCTRIRPPRNKPSKPLQ